MMTRRVVLFSLAAPLLKAESDLRPFRVAVPQAKIDRILRRVRETQFPDALEADDWRYGANWEYMRELTAYWSTKYDWRKTEAKLNSFPQFMARVDDYDIHFYHVRGKGPKPMPLILTHGWPGSVVEFLDVIGPLTDPASFGGSHDEAFDVVVPSLPGFGFSSKPHGQPAGPLTVARLWHKLMTQTLGYSKYGAQGGDWGCIITIRLAVEYPDDLVGIHLNSATVRPAPEGGEPSAEGREWRAAAAAYSNRESAYASIQGTKPQTVAFALADNPVGTAAWITEKLKVWSDSGSNIESVFTKDQILSDVMMYLVTDTAATGVWIYRGSQDDNEGARPRGKINVPTGFLSSPHEMTNLHPPRPVLERDFNLTHYTALEKGGHFAAFEQPKVFVDDVREFFRTVRT
jgi:epoxide hydrolase